MDNNGINIAITQFKFRIATAILNNQDKLNGDKNAFINASELNSILKEFGTNDFTKLLKSPNEKITGSIFEENANGEKMINILRFQDDVATAILNNQDKLNSNYDAYISENELKEVLKFFGVNDVSELLKSEEPEQPERQNPESETEQNPTDIDTNKDKIKTPEQGNNDVAAPEEEPDSSIIKENIFGDNHTAIFDIYNKASADEMNSTAGTMYKESIEDLQQIRTKLISMGEDASKVEEKISALEDLAREQTQTELQKEWPNKKVTIVHYGENGEKTGYLTQSFDIRANNSRPKKDDDTSSDYYTKSVTYDESDKESNTEAEINYKLDYKTKNFEAVVNASAGSDNCNFKSMFIGKKDLKNGGKCNFAGLATGTTNGGEDNTLQLSAAADYISPKKKFSTGAYVFYTRDQQSDSGSSSLSDEEQGEIPVESGSVVSNETEALIYARHKSWARGSAGITGREGVKYYFVKGSVKGKRDIPQWSMSLNGGVDLEYGKVDIEKATVPIYNTQLNARGGLSFKSKELEVNANAAYVMRHLRVPALTQDSSDSNYYSRAASLAASIASKKVEFSTLISAVIAESNASLEFASENDDGNKLSLNTGFKLKINNPLNNGLSPVVDCNFAEGQKPNINVSVVVDF